MLARESSGSGGASEGGAAATKAAAAPQGIQLGISLETLVRACACGRIFLRDPHHHVQQIF